MSKQQGPMVEHRELCSVLCGSLHGRGVWGKMDSCICVAESLCCPPEAITTLFISYGWWHCCVRLFSTPWTVAHQAPLSMEFSRQEYWSWLPYIPDPGITPASPALAGRFFTTVPPGKPPYSNIKF